MLCASAGNSFCCRFVTSQGFIIKDRRLLERSSSNRLCRHKESHQQKHYITQSRRHYTINCRHYYHSCVCVFFLFLHLIIYFFGLRVYRILPLITIKFRTVLILLQITVNFTIFASLFLRYHFIRISRTASLLTSITKFSPLYICFTSYTI